MHLAFAVILIVCGGARAYAQGNSPLKLVQNGIGLEWGTLAAAKGKNPIA